MSRFVGTVEKQFSKVEKIAAVAGGALIAAVSFETVKKTIMLADSYKGLTARIYQSTKATKDYLAVKERVEKMSIDNGVSLETNVPLFQNISRVAPDIGATQKEVLRLVDSLNKLGVVSGSSTLDLKNSLRQFSQSMAGGIVRAEEFNSIIENTPEIASRIAKGLGMTAGQLRLAVVDGKILSKDVFQSLLKQSAEIDKDFSQMPRRIGQSWESLVNGTMKFLGNLDEATGLTGGLATAFQSLAVYLSGDFSQSFFDIKNNIITIGQELGIWWEWITKSFDALSGLTGQGDSFGSTMMTWVDNIGIGLMALPITLKYLFTEGALLAIECWQSIKNGAELIKTGFLIIWEMIKSGANTTAAYVAKVFGGVMGPIMDNMADLALSSANFAAQAGFEDAAMDLNGLSFSLKQSSKGVKSLSKSYEEAAASNEDSIATLLAKTRDIDAAWIDEKALIDQAKEATAAKYQDELKLMEDNRIAREKNFTDQQAKLKAQREADEKMFNSQVGGPGLPPPPGKEKKSRGKDPAQKAAEDAQRMLDEVQKSLSTKLELENQHYAESQASLDHAEQLKLASILPYHELRERLEADHMKKLKEIVRDGTDEMSSIRGWNAFLGVKLQEKAGDMEIEQQAQTFKTLIDDAAEHSKAFFEMKKALAIATALIDAPKAILASFAFGSEIGGPVVGAIFGGIAAAAVGVQMASIASAQYTASKATGGNVFANRAYKVNEQGPEMLSSGGDDILLMGSKGGNITPAHKVGSGEGSGSNVNISIHTLPGTSFTQRTTDGPDGKTIELIMNQLDQRMASNITEGRGKTHAAIQKTYGVNRGKRSA